MFRCRPSLLAVALSSIFIAAGAATAVHAQDLYQGKTLTIVVGNTAGSGYDTYGRLVARYMAKYLSGHPTVVAQNMPGAGSVKAADYIYSVAPKDGTVFGLVVPGALVDPLTAEPSRFRYDPTRFEYIGTADSGTRLCLTRADSAVKTFEDAQSKVAIVAATQPAAYARMLNALTKTKFKIVTGYPGPAEVFMAVERGEADAICALDFNAINTLRPGLLGSPKVNILLQFNIEPKPFLSALGVPQIWKFIAPEDRALVELVLTEQVFQRVFIAPPQTPEANVRALRAAFDEALRNPELLDDARKSNLEINPKGGAEVASYVRKMYDAPRELIERMAKVTRPQ